MLIGKLTKFATFFILSFFVLLPASNCWSHNIVVLQTSQAAPYEKSLEGFMATALTPALIKGQKSIESDTVEIVLLNRQKRGADLAAEVLARQPDLVLALGRKALLRAIDLPESLPIIYLLAPDGGSLSQGQDNISGIEMEIPPARQLAAFIEILPNIKRLGLIYDPAKSKEVVEEARLIAQLNGIELIAEEAGSAQQISGLLADLKGRVDAFWMLPDSTVTNPNTLDALLLFSFENQVPLLTFADKYLAAGATVSVTFDLYDMGVQAGRMAQKVLEHPTHETVSAAEHPEKVNLNLNHKIAAKLGIVVNTASLSPGL
jgi:putative ABC transport system substrate-binding protein